ncbi:MAG: hypothetical protein ACXW11_03475 [Methylotenera sp.]
MSHNLIMIDHASKDRRSVQAMLQGYGDGRDRTWISFKNAYPTLPLEVLMEKFRIEARYGRIKANNRFAPFSQKKYIAALIAFAIILA